MKFPLHLLLASAPQLSSAYYVSTTTPYYSSFLHHNRHHHNHRRHHHHHHRSSSSSSSATRLHYKEPSSNDIGDNESSDGANANANVWSVLANTERWISETLDRSNDAARAANERRDAEEAKREQLEEEQQQKKKMHFADEKQQSEDEQEKSKRKKKRLPRSDNPYARKEVTYVCETGSELASIVGGMFRRVREARELGEGHGRGVEARRENAASAAQRPPTTMRQTNVVVIPNCDELSNFHVFDGLVLAINQARRASRDFVLKREEEEEKEGGDGGQDWVVSINCAHLHPQYGTPSPEEQLRALKHEEEEGEVDLNRLEFKRRRDEARRSPYPSLIVEVQSTPPVDFGRSSSSSNGMRRDEEALEAAVEMETASSSNNVDADVTSDDVRKLEALFGMSAATKSADDTFYEAIGEAFGDKQVASQSPLSLAQAWVLENDPAFDEATSTFTKSDTRHVDAAYEYVFNNLAMLDAADPAGPSSGQQQPRKKKKRGQKSYVVLPNFVPTSATSFDRFAGQVSNIIRAMPGMAERVMVSTFHPEHVTDGTRAPVPIMVITWK